ncbi:MAG: hypothetical protein RIS35_2235 [Pseudomonadota bacterium]
MPDLILLCPGAAADDDGMGANVPSHLERIAEGLRAGAFQRAFSAGAVVARTTDDAAIPFEAPEERWLRQHFGLPGGDAVAASGAACFGIDLPAWHATPCNVRIGHYQLVLDDPAALALSLDEARALGETVDPLFAEAGFALRVADPLEWFLVGRPDLRLHARSATMALGRSIDGYLPQGADASFWRRLFTEVQIAWHEHPVNRARAARGLPVVNALWLDGLAQASLPPRRCVVFSRSPALTGLARRAGGTGRDADLERIGPAELRDAGRDAEVIVEIDFWRRDGADADPYAWNEAWQRFDQWLAGLGVDRGPPAGFECVRAVFGAQRRLVELSARRGFRWLWQRRLDAVAAVLGVPSR